MTFINFVCLTLTFDNYVLIFHTTSLTRVWVNMIDKFELFHFERKMCFYHFAGYVFIC